MRSYKDAKAMAKSLRDVLAARNVSLSHSECLEVVAQQFGFANWNTLSSKLDNEERRPGRPRGPNRALSSTSIGSGEQSSGSLSASSILERVAKVYATAQTYQDSGVVRTTFNRSERTFVTETPFTTAYHRASSRFRFEFFVAPPAPPPYPGPASARQWIIFRSGNQINQWSFLTMALGPAPSLQSAVARATGVSKGTAHYISALLIPNEIGGRKLTADGDKAARLDDARLSTSECYRIQRILQARTGVTTTETVWVEKNSFLIVRIDKHRQPEGVEIDSAISYEPLMDAPISEDALEFNPPSVA